MEGPLSASDLQPTAVVSIIRRVPPTADPPVWERANQDNYSTFGPSFRCYVYLYPPCFWVFSSGVSMGVPIRLIKAWASLDLNFYKNCKSQPWFAPLISTIVVHLFSCCVFIMRVTINYVPINKLHLIINLILLFYAPLQFYLKF